MKEDKKEENKKKLVTQEDIMKVLNNCYEKALNGVPKVSPSIEEFAKNYLDKETNNNKAAKAMIKNQVVKCTTSGFLTGFGGIITLPVTIPANVGSVLYVQMRMIACIAYLAGYDLKSDQVQTLVYACLAGVSVTDVIKQAGIKFGIKLTNATIKKIPWKALIKINQKVGFRFITKAGTTGIINLSRVVPVVGAVAGGEIDYFETKAIANRAYKWFFKNDFSVDDNQNKKEEKLI